MSRQATSLNCLYWSFCMHIHIYMYIYIRFSCVYVYIHTYITYIYTTYNLRQATRLICLRWGFCYVYIYIYRYTYTICIQYIYIFIYIYRIHISLSGTRCVFDRAFYTLFSKTGKEDSCGFRSVKSHELSTSMYIYEGYIYICVC